MSIKRIFTLLLCFCITVFVMYLCKSSDPKVSEIEQTILLKFAKYEAPSTQELEIESILTIPWRSAIKPMSTITKQNWMTDLRNFLLKCKLQGYVVLTTTTWSCITQLIHWLIAARLISSPPVENILVLSYDAKVYDYLIKRDISTIFVNLSDVFHDHHDPIRTEIFMSRLLIIRIINHWGFDVFHYDSDATLLKNPLPLFKRYHSAHVVATRGRYPFELGMNGPWKYTACMGAILFQSSSKTELFWAAVEKVNLKVSDDQLQINVAMKELNITWHSTNWTEADPNVATGNGGFSVTILPAAYACRETCSIKDFPNYYVWHSDTTKVKLSYRSVIYKEPLLNSDIWLQNIWRSSENIINNYFCGL